MLGYTLRQVNFELKGGLATSFDIFRYTKVNLKEELERKKSRKESMEAKTHEEEPDKNSLSFNPSQQDRSGADVSKASL